MSHSPPPIAGPGPYQHWLDDAAQMGLMLYRMRQDSKRERLQQQQQRHARSQPASPMNPPPPPSAHPPPTPEGRMVPVLHHPPVVREPTPRTAAALQTPTVVQRGGNAMAGINCIQSLD